MSLFLAVHCSFVQFCPVLSHWEHCTCAVSANGQWHGGAHATAKPQPADTQRCSRQLLDLGQALLWLSENAMCRFFKWPLAAMGSKVPSLPLLR